MRGAVVTAATVKQIGEELREYFIAPMQGMLASMIEQRTIQLGLTTEPTPWIDILRDAIDSGGVWQLRDISETDANGVESVWMTSDESGLGFLDGAQAFRFDIEDKTRPGAMPKVALSYSGGVTSIRVDATAEDILAIHDAVDRIVRGTVPENYWADPSKVYEVAESVSAEPVSPPPPPRVFIAHGGDRQWEVVRKAVEGAGYEVEVFEADERAGESTLRVVHGMISRSTVGVIVMTATDTLPSGLRRARPNVLHELGMCQGLLGLDQTFIVLENGTEIPSNIEGHIEIRYERGELHTVEERILRAIELRLIR